jgi:outer membrane protein
MRIVSCAGVVLACLNLLPAQTPPLTVNLHDALDRAKAFSPQFLASTVGASLAHEDKVQAKSALLPAVSNFSQYIYTQGDGYPSGVFVANDGVHVYNEQAVVHADLFSATKRADYRRAMAAEAIAQAKQDVALRGLAAAVMQNYYAVIVAQRHLGNATRSVDEAQRFLDITEKQERGGEVARADVIKAQLQLQQRQREQMDAGTNTEKAKLFLGVMLFANIDQPYAVVDDLQPEAPLPPLEETRSLALMANPELRAAEAGVQQAGFGIQSAKGAYLPTLSLDYFFGIDANVFGITGPDSRQNLGSVVQGTMTVPIWNWGAIRSKVRQAELTKQQAETDLTFARRQIQTDVSAFYLEAQAARSQLDSLRSSVDLASESLRLTLLRYEAGEAVALEVVDAQSTLAQARNSYDDGLARYRLALANVQTLTGRF